MPLPASVIVCTHNRSASLRHTILSLIRCDGSGRDFEIVVVDNASTDDTASMVTSLIRDHPGQEVKYVFEPRLGLHSARHAGARAARSQLLLYTDDDVEVGSGWIRAYVDAFAAHPEMLVAGGPAHPRWETDPPSWVIELRGNERLASPLSASWFCLPLALIDRGPEFQLAADGHFFGVNMAIRADALRRFGGFRPEWIADRVVGSGEWGLLVAMEEARVPIGWVPDAHVWHWVPRSRMQPRYFERWVRTESASHMFERWHRAPRGIGPTVRDFARILGSNWRLWLRAARVRAAPDARAILVRSNARRGIYELWYLWQIISRREIRTFLDTERFGP